VSPAAAADQGGPSPWLFSARFDLLAFTLPSIGALALGALAGRLAGPDGATPTWAWVALVLCIDVAHVHGTTVRVYLDPLERRRRPALYAGVPAAGLLLSIAVYSASALLFWRLLAYLAVAHFVRQQIGWLRLYRRRAGDRGAFDRRLDEATVYAATLHPVIAWHARLPDRVHWFVPGDFVAGLPAWCARTSSLVWAALLVAFALRQLQRAARGEAVATGKILLVVTTAATWWMGIVLWRSDFAFTATNVVAHGIPYIAVSYRVGLPARRLDARAPRAAVAALFAPGRLPLYAAALCALAFAEEWLWDRAVWNDHPALFPGPALAAASLEPLVVPLLALPQLTHYLLDAYLWRMDGSNPGLREALGLGSTPAPDPGK
jgi:hypothetical protein